ncbi:MAG TPA: outer membrane beta-barrel protein [Bryobacteraceae bacterium]|jgi:hypothetical protein
MRLAIPILLMTLATLHAQETPRERELQNRIDGLEKRLAEVEAKLAALVPAAAAAPAIAPAPPAAVIAKDAEPGITGFFRGTTLNAIVDGYFEYNFNQPYDRVNQLRGFDQSDNSFSLNQATIVVEHAPDVDAGRRFGARIDLQFGQATQTLQGSTVNEPRPELYRSIYQAYGSYIFPIGSGLQTDFGKFASSLGYETNYTKDQMNYTRSLWFNYLPYYHLGFRTNYNFNSKISAQYWLVNGENESEDFNAFKSQAFLLILKPAKSLTWNATYYVGQEAHAVMLSPEPAGRTHIFDTYLNWAPANSKWSGALEGDYTINRNAANSAPYRVDGGAAYLQYQLTPKFAAAARFELMQDRAGFYSGQSQTLKEFTLTGTRTFADGFEAKLEYRRDFSNALYFRTDTLGTLRRNQETALLGLIWWFGGKTGSW